MEIIYQRKKSSVLMKLFLLLIFTILTYLLLNMEILYRATIFLLIIIIILFVKSQLFDPQPNKESLMHLLRFDTIKISYKYVKINKKYMLASILGLVLATLIISQSMIISTTFQQNSFNNYASNNDSTTYRFMIQEADKSVFDEWVKFEHTQINSWSDSNNLNLVEDSSYGAISANVFLGERYNLDKKQRWVDYFQVTTHQYTQKYFNFLKLFPTFNDIEYDASESLLVVPPWLSFSTEAGSVNYTLSDFIVNHTIQLMVDETYKTTTDLTLPFHRINYTIDNVWQFTFEDYQFLTNTGINIDRSLLMGALFLPEGMEWQLYDTLENAAKQFNETSMVWGYAGIFTNIDSKMPLISEIPLETYSYKISQTLNLIRSDTSLFFYHLNNTIKFRPIVISPLMNLIDTYVEQSSYLQYIILFSSIPIIMVAIYLLYFSMNLIEIKKKNILTTSKIRGTSSEQLKLMITSEIINSALISVAIGMILSLPLSALFLRSSGLFQFNLPAVALVIPEEWYWKVPLIGILLSLEFNMISLMSFINISIEESMDTRNEKPPLWERINLDLILFIGGIIFWIIVPNIHIVDEQMQNYTYSIGGFVALSLIIIGFPFIISRYTLMYLNNFINKVNLKKGIIFLSVKNLVKQRKFVTQLIALLMISMMLGFIALIIPITMNSWNTEYGKYTTGADIYIENISPDNILWNSMHIDGVKSITAVNFMEYTPRINERPTGANVITYHLMGVNKTTFPEAGYWKSEYSKTSIENLMQSLSDNNSIIMQETEMLAYNMAQYSKLTINYGWSGSYSIVLNVTANTTYFPKIISQIPESNANGVYYIDDLHLITNLQTVETIATLTSRYITYGAYISLEDGVNIQNIIEQLGRVLSSDRNILIHPYTDRELVDNNQILYLISSMHTLLLLTLLITIVSLSYYSFITIAERKRELAIYRSLGMIRKQITKLLIYELTIILFIGLVGGFIAGSIISKITFILLEKIGMIKNTIPMPLVYSPLLLLGYAILMFIISAFVSFIPAIKVSKQETGSVLRAT